MRKILPLVVLSLALIAGRAPAQDSMPALPAHASGQTILIRAAANSAGKPEAAPLLARLAAYFGAAGYKVVDASAQPQYLAVFQVALETGKVVMRQVAEPEYGTVRNSTDTGMGMSMDGMSGATPQQSPMQYGIIGYRAGMQAEQQYNGALVLDVFQTVEGGKVNATPLYHVQLAASGTCGTMSALIEPMLTLLFKNFPANIGKNQNSSAPARRTSC